MNGKTYETSAIIILHKQATATHPLKTATHPLKQKPHVH